MVLSHRIHFSERARSATNEQRHYEDADCGTEGRERSLNRRAGLDVEAANTERPSCACALATA